MTKSFIKGYYFISKFHFQISLSLNLLIFKDIKKVIDINFL